MKKKLLVIGGTALILSFAITLYIFISLFFLGNSRAKGIITANIEVFSDELKMTFDTPYSGEAFKNYAYKIDNGNVYITLNYVLSSKKYNKGRAVLDIKDDFSKTENIYLKAGKENILIWNKTGNKFYTYRGNLNSDGIEINDTIISQKMKDSILKNVEILKNELVKNKLHGIDIKLHDIDENNILTIDLIDGAKKVTEYLDSGSTGGKINLDILTYTLLQPESNINKWIDGIKILLNGEKNVEGSHFNLEGVLMRTPKSKTLAYITDYGYDQKPLNYKTEYIVNNNAQQFVITPIDDETTISVYETYYEGDLFVEGKKLFETSDSMLFVMELPEGMPYIEVKMKRGDRTSSWFPFFNGYDGSLIVPEEFEIR